MSRASARIVLNLVDVTAKEDGEYATNDIYNQCNIDLLDNEDNYTTKKYATCEQDIFLLDGSFTLMDDDIESSDFCYWSNNLSDSKGKYKTNPTITRQFDATHSSAGITLTFDSNYPLPKLLKISLYDYEGTLLNEAEVSPDSWYNYFVSMRTNDYKKMVIEFEEVNPYQRARLKSIVYGQTLEYSESSDKNLSSATLLENTNMYSIEVPISTSSIKLVDTDELFNITNPEGLYSMLQERQKIEIYEKLSNESSERLMAVHYIKEWETENGNTSIFSCQDIVGLLDGGSFKGNLYEGVSAGDIVKEIFDDFGFNKYELDEQLASNMLYGVIKPCTHREALQQVMFAINGCVDTSRNETIVLKKVSKNKHTTISNDREFLSPQYTITQANFVSGVEVTAHNYIKDYEISQAYSGTLSSGTYEVTFSEPFDKDNLVATNCTILNSGNFYAQIEVSQSAEVKIEGYKYTDYTSLYLVQSDELPSGTKPKINQISDATLVSRSNARIIARNLYEYYQYRLEHSLSIICDDERIGTFSQIQTPNGNMTSMLINELDIELTKGFIASVSGVGYALREKDFLYTGHELVSGEKWGII